MFNVIPSPFAFALYIHTWIYEWKGRYGNVALHELNIHECMKRAMWLGIISLDVLAIRLTIQVRK